MMTPEHEADRLDKQADTIESLNLTREEDRVHLRAFAGSLRARAMQIRAESEREARIERSIREAEDEKWDRRCNSMRDPYAPYGSGE